MLTFLCTETGTTTIQRRINSDKLRSQLALDNYKVIEHRVIHNHKSINKIDGSYSFSDEFIAVVEQLKTTQANSNIFGSSEYLYADYPRGAKGCSSVRNVLLGNTKNGEEGWKLHIVYTHRQLYDKLPSGWNQRFKFHRENGNPMRIGHIDWPEDGGNRIIPFYEWIHKQLGEEHKFLQRYNSWKSCSDSISVVNFYNHTAYPPNGTTPVEADLVSNFVCNGIPDASHTCSFLLQEKEWPETTNPSVAFLDFDMLAVYAHETGLISSVWRRKEVTKKIVQFAASNEIRNNSLPIRCPNATTLQLLYDHSLELERAVMATKNKTQQKLNFDIGWEKALEKQMFCNYDPEEIVKREEWKAFFEESF